MALELPQRSFIVLRQQISHRVELQANRQAQGLAMSWDALFHKTAQAAEAAKRFSKRIFSKYVPRSHPQL
jgi:hypothetical protein